MAEDSTLPPEMKAILQATHDMTLSMVTPAGVKYEIENLAQADKIMTDDLF